MTRALGYPWDWVTEMLARTGDWLRREAQANGCGEQVAICSGSEYLLSAFIFDKFPDCPHLLAVAQIHFSLLCFQARQIKEHEIAASSPLVGREETTNGWTREGAFRAVASFCRATCRALSSLASIDSERLDELAVAHENLERQLPPPDHPLSEVFDRVLAETPFSLASELRDHLQESADLLDRARGSGVWGNTADFDPLCSPLTLASWSRFLVVWSKATRRAGLRRKEVVELIEGTVTARRTSRVKWRIFSKNKSNSPKDT